MVSFLGKLAGYVALAVFVVFILTNLTQSAAFPIVVAIAVVMIIFFAFRGAKRNADREATLPEVGPMQVNITSEEIKPGSFNYKRLKCALKIDVKISKQDWEGIKRMGLKDRLLFTYPAPSGDASDTRDFIVGDLDQANSIGFNDAIQREEAKAALIQGLQNLRSQLAARSLGPVTETIEI